MELTRIMHVLNIDGEGKDVFLVNGMEPKDDAIKRSVMKKIVDYEFLAAGKPSGWSGMLDDMYYASGTLSIQGRRVPFSYYSVKPSEEARQDLLLDLKAHGYSIVNEEREEVTTAPQTPNPKVVLFCIAGALVIGIIVLLLCK